MLYSLSSAAKKSTTVFQQTSWRPRHLLTTRGIRIRSGWNRGHDDNLSILRLFTSLPSASQFLIRILPEVSEALSNNKPVVALESTILAHGLPHPQNIQLAQDISTIIRSIGAIPATIAVQDGICRVGLTVDELHDLAISGVEERASKCSTRDLPFILAKHQMNLTQNASNDALKKRNQSKCQWGATTVAATMHIAHLANITTFVTGGTGGVHREGESTMDVSADLLELARTPVIVVSAGVKSILDINRTLEVLETNGVPVAAWGVDDFPAFFSPESGVKAPARVDSAQEVATAFWAGKDLGLTNGMLIAVPNKDTAGEAVERAIQETLQEANSLGVVGRDVTPFVLKQVAEKTGGDSLKSNIELVKGNAAVGADIAVALALAKPKELEWGNKSQQHTPSPTTNISISSHSHSQSAKDYQSRVAVMGGAVVDLVAKPAKGQALIPGTSNPGICFESDGGVGRNIAEVLGRLGSKPILFSAVGGDARGSALKQRMQDDYDISHERQRVDFVDESNTATYLAVLNENGDLHTAIADMGVLEQIPVPDEESLSAVDYLVVDANPPIQSLIRAAQNAKRANTKVCFEPTSVPKAASISKSDTFMSAISYAFPNLDELFAMANMDVNDSFLETDDSIQAAARVVLNRCHSVESHLIVTMGAKGVMLVSKYEMKPMIFKRFEVSFVELKNCTGAGDTLAGAFINALLNGCNQEDAVKIGMEKAVLSLNCEDCTISPHL